MSTFLVTGAAGYIGSMVVRSLLQQREMNKTDISIAVLVRNESKARALYGESVSYIVADIIDEQRMSWVTDKFDYIIHCAATTKSSEMISNPAEVAWGIVAGTRNVLELARRCEVKSMIFLSSMEVYGNIDCADGDRVGEEELGEVALLSARSCYPLGKRMAENMCYSYYQEYHIPVKIARMAQTFGRGVSKSDTRVFAQFAKSVLEKKDIVLHTLGNSMGNYCGIDDAVKALFLILEKGQSGDAYNVVAEENTMTIREMAEVVANQIAGKGIEIVCDAEEGIKYGYASDTGLRLSSKKLRDLGWSNTQTLSDMYRDLLADWT